MIDITKSSMHSLKDMMQSIKNTKFVYVFIKIRVFLEIFQIFPQILRNSRNPNKISFGFGFGFGFLNRKFYRVRVRVPENPNPNPNPNPNLNPNPNNTVLDISLLT